MTQGVYLLHKQCQDCTWEVSPKLAQVTPRYKRRLKPEERPTVSSPEEAEAILRRVWDRDLDYCEIAVVLLLDGAHKLLGWMKLSEGGRNSATIEPAKLFTIALVTNSSAFILAHSHPSGTLTPSEADKMLTKKLLDGAALLSLTFLDHLIITSDSCLSFKRDGYL